MRVLFLLCWILLSPSRAVAYECPSDRPDSFQSLKGFSAIMKSAFSKQKGEFEKTEDFEKRRKDSISSLTKPVALFYHATNTDFSYNADREIMNYKLARNAISEIESNGKLRADFIDLDFGSEVDTAQLSALFDFPMKADAAELFRTSSYKNSVDYVFIVLPREPYFDQHVDRISDGRYVFSDILPVKLLCVYLKAFDIYTN